MSAVFSKDHEDLLAETSDATRALLADVQELKRGLLSQQERESAPDQVSVKDLEARLLEAETKAVEAAEELEKSHLARCEELRAIVIAQSGEIEQQRTQASRFDGFLANAPEMLERALSWCRGGGVKGEARAIDTTAIGSAGAMSAETLSAFLDYVVEISPLLNRINVVRMRANTRNLDRMVISKQNIRATTEGAALAVSDSASFAKRTLSTVGIGWNEDVTLEWLEDNIEGAAGQDHLAMAVAQQFSNDVVDLALNADATTASFLDITSGFSKLARGDADVIDYDSGAASDASPTDLFRGMLLNMPPEYRGLPGMSYTVPQGVAMNYVDQIASRATGLGDAALINGIQALRYFGIPVYGEALMNSAAVGAETADAAFLTPDQNLAVGFQREISFNAEYVPRKRLVELTLDTRFAVQHAFGGIFVLADNIVAGITD